jgi:hypothetical protein
VAAIVLLALMNMNSIAALISTVSLTGFSWAACPVPSRSDPMAGQKSTLEDLRETGFRYFQEGQYRTADSGEGEH